MIQARLNLKWRAKQPKSLVLFDREVPVSEHVPFTHFIAPSVMMTEKGELASIMHLQGISFEVKGIDELNRLHANLSFIIQTLSDEYAVYVTMYRHRQPVLFNEQYPLGFAKVFMQHYQSVFQGKSLFVNDIYFTLIQKAGSTLVKRGLHWFTRLKSNRLNARDEIHKLLKKFTDTYSRVFQALHAYSPRVLTEGEGGIAEPLSLLSIIVNGYARHYRYPETHLGRVVPEKRLFFGNSSIHFKANSDSDDTFAAILSLKDYSANTPVGYLDTLLTLPVEYIATHSFVPIDKQQAINTIDLQYNRMLSVDDAAVSQLDALRSAQDDVASSRLSFGYHHHTIMILGASLSECEENVSVITKAYTEQQLVVVRETLNLESAFYAQIPANFRYIRRESLISSLNFAAFISLHNYYTGYRDKTHLPGSLMLLETASHTPLWFNLHEPTSGKKEDFSKGHTVLIGPSNTGKTALMTAINTAFQAYGIRSFFFDRNLGCEIYVRAMGGLYYRLSPGESTGWNPCQLADTAKNRAFLRDWLTVLASSSSYVLTPADLNQIAEVVDRNFTLPREKRYLSNIASFFRLDFSGLENLSRFTRLADRTGRCGALSWLFDNDADTLTLNCTTMGFDMTHLLSDANSHADILTPTLMYLFHRIDSALDGKLTGLYLDEGWQFLASTYWLNKINEYLVTWRKLNAFVVFATQLPSQVAQSPLGPALIQGSATAIFFANSKAEAEDYMDAFKLSQREFEWVKTLDPHTRYFLLKQGHEAAIARIPPAGMRPYLKVLSGNVDGVKHCETLRHQYGEEWLASFLHEEMT